jgi:hypothetical protein
LFQAAKFYELFNDFLDSKVPGDATTVIGCDTNCQVGKAKADEKSYRGQFGKDQVRNDASSRKLRELLLVRHGLRVASFDFEHKRNDTYLDFNTKKQMTL